MPSKIAEISIKYVSNSIECFYPTGPSLMASALARSTSVNAALNSALRLAAVTFALLLLLLL